MGEGEVEMPPPVALPSSPLVVGQRTAGGIPGPPPLGLALALPRPSIHFRSLRVCGVRLHNGLPRRAAADHHSVRQEGPVRRRTRANERTYVAVAVAVAVAAFCRPGQASTLALSGASVCLFACSEVANGFCLRALRCSGLPIAVRANVRCCDENPYERLLTDFQYEHTHHETTHAVSALLP